MVSADQEPSDILAMPNANGKLVAVIAQLSRARRYAQDAHCDPWEFALEIESLTTDGLTTNDLRWLVKQGHIEHACDISRNYDLSRRFQPCRNLSFPKRTCFILTEKGTRLAPPALTLLAAQLQKQPLPTDPRSSSSTGSNRLAPSWDRDRRVLRVGDIVVKQFRVPSPNQEAILVAFEEEGWPAAIDDPLPYRPGRDPKRRLRNTVQSLNTHQKNRVLRFRGNGGGTRLLWELTGEALMPLVGER